MSIKAPLPATIFFRDEGEVPKINKEREIYVTYIDQDFVTNTNISVANRYVTPRVGMIGCQLMFDCTGVHCPFDPFVVVDISQQASNKMSVIYPRMRMNKEGKLEFGQDRATENLEYFKREECYSGWYFPCKRGCICGARSKAEALYDTHFTSKTTDYQVFTIPWPGTTIGPDLLGYPHYLFPPSLQDIPLLPLLSRVGIAAF